MEEIQNKNWHPVLITLHWLVAITVLGLFALGWWMVDLTYYHAWYKTAPFIHKSIGLMLFLAMILRLLIRICTTQPLTASAHAKWELWLASKIHFILYLIVFSVVLSGYFISTADGRGISVFGLFEVPALITPFTNQADIAGKIHWYAAWALMVFVGLHILGALKHHYLDKDETLKRMLGKA
ncbi:cytochrome b [Photobacterium lucens]|uniref:cytochrome b n=1 Tax=Photobacterium lucens TaxID=2562949 RepID=UPI001367B041|nr:cytochrome b [Photobacterium lucens]MBP2701347.1 cytochrome b [Vibrio parahaemolyticus]MZG56599.1 cytochrome b [Photobacterium lucens]MZG80743.1 cytochrome b [Photobacterium lucens]